MSIQTASRSALTDSTVSIKRQPTRSSSKRTSQNAENVSYNRELVRYSKPAEIVSQLNSGQLLVVDSKKRCGLIVYKGFHAEFAGPGSAVGSFFDIGQERIIPIGDLTLIYPEKYEERQQAYAIRRKWIQVMEDITTKEVPLKRAEMILERFEQCFDRSTAAQIPDESLSLLVGVMPSTIRKARRYLSKKGEKTVAQFLQEE